MHSTKYKGLSYPDHFKKSRSSVIRNNVLKYRTKQVNIFARRNVLYTLFATNKAKQILSRYILCFCNDSIYGKSIKKQSQKGTFLKIYHFSISQHFSYVKA